MSKEDSGFSAIYKVAGTVFTGAIPILYIMGYYYEKGWLHSFGIGESIVDKSIQEQLLNSYSLITNVLSFTDSVSMLAILAVAAWIFFTFLFYVLIQSAKWASKYVKRYVERADLWLLSSKNELLSSAQINAVYIFAPLVLFYIAFLLAVPAKIAFDIGARNANEARSNINDCVDKRDVTWSACATITFADGTSHKGYVVINNNDYIALYSENETRIIDKKSQYVIERSINRGNPPET